ncbi:MAG TPA: GNAT family acetyltransferase [Fimbriimonadaceae bacterium]|nr:GNAT family acetyltransferase [Fimbriimonadaceae bacterium]
MPSVEIREMREADAAQVIALWDQVFAYPAPHNRPERAIQDKLAYQPELLFVATEGEKVLGTVMGGYDGHRGWIYSLAVAPEARRRGIGSALVRHVEGVLLAQNCGKVNLQILADNDGVVAFYKKLGYTVEPRISMGKVL